jgi:ketosteroid isomerase-like protein
MSIEENKAIACKFVQAMSDSDVAAFASVISDDIVMQTMGSSVMSRKRTKEGMAEVYRTILTGCPNGVTLEIKSVTAEDDRVSVEVQGSAMTASGRSYNNQYHFLFVMRDGKVRELREYADTKLLEETFGPLLKADPTLKA